LDVFIGTVGVVFGLAKVTPLEDIDSRLTFVIFDMYDPCSLQIKMLGIG
jgi:hypothetical protein